MKTLPRLALGVGVLAWTAMAHAQGIGVRVGLVTGGLAPILLAQAPDVTEITGREISFVTDPATGFGVADLSGREISLLADNPNLTFAVTNRTGREITLLTDNPAVSFPLIERSGRDVTVAPGTRINISVSFGSLSDPLRAPTTVDALVVDPGTNEVLYDIPAVPVVNGIASVLVPQSIVRVSLKEAHWLRRTLSFDARQPGPLTGSMAFLNGDVNEDNEVGAADFSVLAASYDLVLGDPGFIANADLNRDDEVGAADFSILAANYDQSGDEP